MKIQGGTAPLPPAANAHVLTYIFSSADSRLWQDYIIEGHL